MLVIDKPAGCTSFDVIRTLRRVLGVHKMGHAGTLDPFATGVLVVGVGKETKQLASLLHADKEYEADLLLGVETDSYDLTGAVVHVASEDAVRGVTRDRFAALIPLFLGEIEQTPPVYSALKIKGQRAADRVRAGEQVVLKSRRVRIDAIEVIEFLPALRTTLVSERFFPAVRIRVRSGGGMYVRSLAHDFGARLGVGAHLVALRRTQVGPYRIEQAVPLAEVTTAHLASLLAAF